MHVKYTNLEAHIYRRALCEACEHLAELGFRKKSSTQLIQSLLDKKLRNEKYSPLKENLSE